MTPEIERFIERLGLFMERLGLSRTAGRVLGLLIVSEEPLSLGQLARELQVSKASVSVNARMCQQMGLVERVGIPGERRDYYEMCQSPFEHAVRVRLLAVAEGIKLAQIGLDAVGNARPKARARLEEMRDLYTYMGALMEKAVFDWGASRPQGGHETPKGSR